MSDLTEAAIKKLKVNELKAELSKRGLQTGGRKEELLKRLLKTVTEDEDVVPDSDEDVPLEGDHQDPELEAAIQSSVNQDDTHASEGILEETSQLPEEEVEPEVSDAPVKTPAAIPKEVWDPGASADAEHSESTDHTKSKVPDSSNAVGTTFQGNESEATIESGVNQDDTHASEEILKETSPLPEEEKEDSDAPMQTPAAVTKEELCDPGASVGAEDNNVPMASEYTDHCKSKVPDSDPAYNSKQEVSKKRSLEENQNGDKEGAKRHKDAKRHNFAIGNQPLLKLLVPNYAAGRLIGKGGSLLTELRSKYGGNLRLSANKEFYPDTDERVVVITGEVSQIIDINKHIMEVVQEPAKNRPEDIRDKQVKIVLTNFVAGLLIGKGGETVKAINEESKAKLSIAQRDGSSVPGERVLTMSGTIDQRTEGCRMVIEKIANDESNMKNTNLKYGNSGTGISENYGNSNNQFAPSTQNVTPYGGNNNQFAPSTQNAMSYGSNDQFSYSTQNAMSYGSNDQFSPHTQNAMPYGSNNQFSPPTQNAMPYGSNNQFSPPTQNAMPYGMGGLSNQGSKSPLKTTVQVQMEVPDNLVTVLMGKQGQTIKELVKASGGARFKFSDKNDFVPGTNNRMLTITGSMDQAKSAYSLVNQKVDSGMGRQQQWGMY